MVLVADDGERPGGGGCRVLFVLVALPWGRGDQEEREKDGENPHPRQSTRDYSPFGRSLRRAG